MDISIKVRGATRNWVLNVLLLLTAIILALMIIIIASVHNNYYDSVSSYINSIAGSFDRLAVCDSSAYYEEARSLSTQFTLKNQVEVQILDTGGTVIVSTSGFLPPKDEKMPDYEKAVSHGISGEWTGYNSGDEHVMASTYILADYGNGSNGAVRCVVSLQRLDRHILFINLIIISFAIILVLVAAFSGIFFVRSIIKPISEISNVARKIALGDFKARLKIQEPNSEIGELCDTINYMASELESTDKMKNEFISSVSHELRTPLTAIRGWGETISDSNVDRELAMKGVSVILNETTRLSGLVEELLDFSRIQTGKMSYKNEKIDILAEIGEAVYAYQQIASKNDIQLLYKEPESVSAVMGDPDRLEQVFINIIDNAIKYTSSGGTINVDVEEAEGCVRIGIADTGAGIPADKIDRIKEKFFKANNTVRGSGIGLAVADEIIKHHNGLLLIDSTEGVGTTVTVVLPTVKKAQPESTLSVEGTQITDNSEENR
ncbi:MAG: HAMP domain-containing histidine kinase [Clostridia bacterium]|nr:HAMP domain-containing histidine kinase [Clostridia bacterium]